MARILVIEDEPILRTNICDRLRAEGHEVVESGSGESGVELATLLAPDLVLTDLKLPGINGLAVLREIRRVNPRTMVVMLTAHGSEKTSVEALREGAYDYLDKPIDLKELVLLIDRAVSHCRALDGFEYSREVDRRMGTLPAIVGVSSNIRTVKNLVRQIAASPAIGLKDPPNVLITGETGSGKDLIAHAIHHEGPRKDGPFVHVNCTAVSETLFESELFGHIKGAFTDARTAKKGLIQVAEGGTIFLDEIGHLSTSMQAKLLVMLEKRMIRPVGATDERPVNVHIIAATNRDLQHAISRNEFRPDLFHRLRVFEVHLEALRDRREDIILLAEMFSRKHALRIGRAAPSLSAAAVDALRRYDWPGNVRELSNCIESALLVCDGSLVDERHLRLETNPGATALHVELTGSCRIEVDFEQGSPTLEQIELRIICAAFEHARQNVSRTARILGLTREAVRYRLAKANASPGSSQAG